MPRIGRLTIYLSGGVPMRDIQGRRLYVWPAVAVPGRYPSTFQCQIDQAGASTEPVADLDHRQAALVEGDGGSGVIRCHSRQA